MAITMSEAAANKIRALVGGEVERGLRLKVVGGGCSGLSYKMDLDVPRQGDRIFEEEGARIIVDRKSFLYLNGTELHYEEGLMQSGFNIQNPNVKRACGCGASFSV